MLFLIVLSELKWNINIIINFIKKYLTYWKSLKIGLMQYSKTKHLIKNLIVGFYIEFTKVYKFID